MSIRHVFTLPDYIVFSVTIAISLGIGVFAALSGGRQRTTKEFLVGNRELRVLPVTLSLIVSFESSIMMLGFPGEIYTYGVQFWWSSVSWCVAMVLIAFLMVPTFFDLKLVSAYEYLQARFGSRLVRLIGSFLGVMINLWYMGIVLFGPATALHAVTGFQMWYSVVVISVVAIIYTTLGGIKAVIWADAFQSFIMIAGMLAVIIKGSLIVGGFQKVLEINKEGGRLEFFNFDADPTVRLTFWSVTFLSVFKALGLGTNQTSVQRISTMPTKRKAQLVTAASGFGFFIFGSLAFMEGLVAYAYFTYKNCDPLEAKLIKGPNQIIPYFVMDLFASNPGLPGLFLAALFSASLSTLSSGYSSFSAIVLTDVIKPNAPNLSDVKATVVAKVLVIIAGLISTGLAILVMQVGGPMTEIAGTILSVFSGPLTGLFLLGGMVPKANSKGAITAVILSSIFSMWKGMGSSFSPDVIKTPYLPGGSIENCTLINTTMTHLFMHHTSPVTMATLNMTEPTNGLSSALQTFYSISYLYISPIAILITLLVGTIVSYATGGRSKKDINPDYLMPVCDRLFCYLPEKFRAVFRYIPYENEELDKIELYGVEIESTTTEKMLDNKV